MRAHGEVWCVLVAAGRGERLGAGRPKAFVPFRGKPLLAESLVRLDACPLIDGIVLVAPPDWEEPAILCAEDLGTAKVSACVAGGETRTESVRIGVAEVPDEAAIVLVHDAARPLVDDAVVERVLDAIVADCDGAVPGLPLADTIKRAPGGIVAETLERSELVAVQTPQGFRADVFRRALAGAGGGETDCSSIVERAGGRIRIVPGDPRLLKVTTAVDLARVDALATGAC